MSTKERADAAGARGPDPGTLAGRIGPLLAGAALALGTLLLYGGTLRYPFILDDIPAIAGNPSVRGLWSALAPPQRLPVSGRPLLNLSYALNYALGRYDVRGYHAFNIAVHALCALALFGIVRRTLAGPALGARHGLGATPVAFLAAALWAFHPLTTEAVTYVSERAESLMGLFYLSTLYLFVRARDSRAPAPWLAASALSCLLGVLTKEVIATAPLVVLLYDRAFCSGSLAAALRARWRYYAGLAAALAPLALLLPGAGRRGVGFGAGVGALEYARLSCRSVALYLRLSLWPHPLVFDYGPASALPAGGTACALLVAALVALAALALVRRPATGFVCAWFLAILAPTSSFIPLAYQPTAEHRAYLPLAAVACAAALCARRLLGRWAAPALAAAAALLGILAHERNRDYRTELAIWGDTAAKAPGNPRAHCNLGVALAGIPGREPEAMAEYREALRLDPGYAEAHNDSGLLLARALGSYQDAAAEFGEAIRSRPDYVEAHDNLGMALAALPGRLPDAVREYGEAIRLDPGYAKAHNDLGVALAGMPGRLADGAAQFEEALRLEPDYPDARRNLELARRMLGPPPPR
jgi:tetratricopeptide (TPR) repeat protein